MANTIELSDEADRLLTQRAEALGLAPAELLERLVRDHAAQPAVESERPAESAAVVKEQIRQAGRKAIRDNSELLHRLS